MAGAILFNGNAETEEQLIRAAAPLILSSRHKDFEIADSKRVLLVTGGWAEDEYNEGHVKAALNAIGVRSQFDNGFDRTLVNLSLYHELKALFTRERALEEAWAEQRRVVGAARSLYLAHNAHLIALFRRALTEAKELDFGLTLPRLMREEGHSSEGRPLLRFALSRELRQTMQTLEANDDNLVSLLRELEQRAFDGAGVTYNPTWRATRKRLERRILNSNTIILFGGRLDILLDGLRFFRLREPMIEAMRRGTQFVAMSAGAMVLCERVIIYNDLAETPRDFQLYDRGLEVVRELQLFPHCMERIQTDDADNLSYLAHRFRHHICVGLNQRSFLMLETSPRRAISMGPEDGVYVFGPEGGKTCYGHGERIPV